MTGGSSPGVAVGAGVGVGGIVAPEELPITFHSRIPVDCDPLESNSSRKALVSTLVNVVVLY